MWFDSAVVLYGCSVIAGHGVDPCDRLAVVLGSKISRPVIDLSQVAIGCDVIVDSQREFHRRWGPPWMEIVCWTEPQRFTLGSKRFGSWNHRQWPETVDHRAEHWQQQALEYRREFLQRSPRFWEFSWNRFWVDSQPQDIKSWTRSQWQDHTLDQHPGPKTIRSLADLISQEIYNR